MFIAGWKADAATAEDDLTARVPGKQLFKPINANNNVVQMPVRSARVANFVPAPAVMDFARAA